MKHMHPNVSVFATHFKVESGGQELLMNSLFFYIFILLTGKSEVCRVFKQLLENHQVTEKKPQWRGKKILVVSFCVISSSLPDSLSWDGLRDQGIRHRKQKTVTLEGPERLLVQCPIQCPSATLSPVRDPPVYLMVFCDEELTGGHVSLDYPISIPKLPQMSLPCGFNAPETVH